MSRKWVLILLTCVLAIGLFPLIAFAAEGMSEEENNDSLATAQAMQVNTVYNGRQDTSALDDDWFKITTTQTGWISVVFTRSDIKENGFRVQLIAGDQKTQLYSQYTEKETTLLSPKIGVGKGTYYIYVSCTDKENEQYTIKASFTAANDWEQEPNSGVKTAMPISLNKRYYGSLAVSGDEDFYKLVLPEATSFYIAGSRTGDFTSFHSFILKSDGKTLLYDTYHSATGGYIVDGNDKFHQGKFTLNAGTYYVKIRGVDGDGVYSFMASTGIVFDEATVGVDGIENKPYTGKAVTQDLFVSALGKGLKEGRDYTVEYTNNVKVGTATITLTGKGEYVGTIKKTFKIIERTSISQCTITGIKTSYTYTGEAIEPGIVVSILQNGKRITLTADKDYTVEYKNNIKPGTATATIKGIGIYKGTVQKTFKIAYKSAVYSVKIVNEDISVGDFYREVWLYDKNGEYLGWPFFDEEKWCYKTSKNSKWSYWKSSSAVTNGKYQIGCEIKIPAPEGIRFVSAKQLDVSCTDGYSDCEVMSVSDTYIWVRILYDSNQILFDPIRRMNVNVDYDYFHIGTSVKKFNTDYLHSTILTKHCTGEAFLMEWIEEVEDGTDYSRYVISDESTKIKKGKKYAIGLELFIEDEEPYYFTENAICIANGKTAERRYRISSNRALFYLPIGYAKVGISLSDAVIKGAKATEFTGYAITPTLTVTLKQNGKTITLKEGRDYEVSYRNNINPGTATITIKGKGNYKGTATQYFTIVKGKPEYLRLSGADRYETSLAIADEYKKTLGVDKFDKICVADGVNYPDALAGAYFAHMNKAPIVDIRQNAPTGPQTMNAIAYIKKNLKPGGLVYILGGPGSVPDSIAFTLKSAGFKVIRLWGENRYSSNLEILKASKIPAGTDFIVTTGADFPDALTVSATGKPVLLVIGNALTADQKAYLATAGARRITIVGSQKEVTAAIEAELKIYAPTTRLGAANAYDRSIAVAKKFFTGTQTHINLADGRNFPDALCGGALAVKKGGPLFLTDGSAAVNKKILDYAKAAKTVKATVYGGPASISDATCRCILSMK